MIHKLTGNEYLKRVGAMDANEKRQLADRIGEWLGKVGVLLPKAGEPLARMQNVIQLGGAWDESAQQAFNDGALLLSAFMGVTDTWLPDMLYTKSVKRSILLMYDVLKTNVGKITVRPQSAELPERQKMEMEQSENRGVQSNARATGGVGEKATATDTNTVAPRTNSVVPHAKKVAPKRKAIAPNGNLSSQNENRSPAVAPSKTETATESARPSAVVNELKTIDPSAIVPRPKHIDQYIHLLPEDTQKRAAQYGTLMRDLGMARNNLRLLIVDPKATAAERERWAKAAVKIDGRIAALRKELDDEWSRVVATGRVVLDDLGMAHLVDPQTGKVSDPKPKVTIPTDDKKGTKPKRSHHKKVVPEKAMTDEEKKRRISYLQKWLRDPRPEATPEHKKQWGLNIKELIALGGRVTKSIVKAGEHYGVKMPKGV